MDIITISPRNELEVTQNIRNSSALKVIGDQIQIAGPVNSPGVERNRRAPYQYRAYFGPFEVPSHIVPELLCGAAIPVGWIHREIN